MRLKHEEWFELEIKDLEIFKHSIEEDLDNVI